jgi:hypothetical protein
MDSHEAQYPKPKRERERERENHHKKYRWIAAVLKNGDEPKMFVSVRVYTSSNIMSDNEIEQNKHSRIGNVGGKNSHLLCAY